MKLKNTLYKRIKNEYLGKTFSIMCGIFIIIITLSIITFIVTKGIRTFSVHKYPLFKFLFSSNWKPDASNPQFGSLIFILGSIIVSLGAILISSPIAVALAIFINYISPKIGEKVLKPALELFVGIPSVVYGLIGVNLLIPYIKKSYGGVGFSLFAGIIILSIMILPTIASIASDAIRDVPKDYVEASYGLGATRWQTINKVIIPTSKGGILTGIVFGLSRAFGEALAVQMVIGNSIRMPNNLIKPTTTLTSVLTMDMANTLYGTIWNDALWSLALILLIISFGFILIIRYIGKKEEK